MKAWMPFYQYLNAVFLHDEETSSHKRRREECRFASSPNWQIRGFSEREIGQLHARCALPLPKIYLDFLRVMGHRAGSFLDGTDIVFPNVLSLLRLQDLCRRCMAKRDFILPSDAFVFGTHVDYSFSYFLTKDQHPDPRVYFWHDIDGLKTNEFESFSKWLTTAVDGWIEFRNWGSRAQT